MKTVGQIVRERREALGLTLGALASEVGATKSYLSMIENHRVSNPPSATLVGALERALGITGGELTRAANWENTPAEVREELRRAEDAAAQGRELARWLKASATPRGEGGKSLDKLFRSGELSRRVGAVLRGPGAKDQAIDAKVPLRYQVPLINRVAAGYPRDFTDLNFPARVADEYVSCPDLSDPTAFAARVVGESMLPDYQEGDVVVFSPAAEVVDGCDCFVRLEPDHACTFKRVFFDNGSLRLQPLNPKFPPQTVKRQEVAGMYRAVWRFQRLGGSSRG